MNTQRIDLLISLIASDEETRPQWNEFEAVASADPGLWRELAIAQHQHSTMSRAMSELTTAADRVGLPEDTAVQGVGPVAERSEPVAGRIRVLSWSGWVVAAMLGVIAGVWFAVAGQQGTVPAPVTPVIATRGPSTPDEAFQAYLDLGRQSGRVFGEMPTKILLETRRARVGGGYELVYLRQVIESMQVPDLYQLDGRNEQGQPVLVRWQQPKRRDM